MLSKRYESAEVNRRTSLRVPSGTHWSTSSVTHQVVEIQLGTFIKIYTPFSNRVKLLRCIHHFLDRVKLTPWTICAFRVLNPRQ